VTDASASHLRGILSMLLAVAAFSIMDASMKALAPHYPPMQVAALRGITSLPLVLVAQQAFASLDKFPLAAVPFFILAGNLMGDGGISTRLVEFAKSIVGGVQGGLPCTCILTCMIFAAVSGSSVATIALNKVCLPPTLTLI
jgi:TRAP-type mannitol/chloroaromatic compound transport system permease large subunit